jgi:hypothetical protein
MSDMSELFILQNHNNLFLGKQKEWLDGRDPGSLFKTPYKDEAVNQMFEISSKDYTQRIKVLACKVSDKGLPVIEQTLLPETQPNSAPLFVDEMQSSGAGTDDESIYPDALPDTIDDDLPDADADADADADNSEADIEADNRQNSLL